MASKVFRKVLLNSRGFATAADSSHHGAGSILNRKSHRFINIRIKVDYFMLITSIKYIS